MSLAKRMAYDRTRLNLDMDNEVSKMQTMQPRRQHGEHDAKSFDSARL